MGTNFYCKRIPTQEQLNSIAKLVVSMKLLISLMKLMKEFISANVLVDGRLDLIIIMENTTNLHGRALKNFFRNQVW